LLIADVVMPDLSGTDFAIQMKIKYPKCKILLFSGLAWRYIKDVAQPDA
jgi:hypothetical protein